MLYMTAEMSSTRKIATSTPTVANASFSAKTAVLSGPERCSAVCGVSVGLVEVMTGGQVGSISSLLFDMFLHLPALDRSRGKMGTQHI